MSATVADDPGRCVSELRELLRELVHERRWLEERDLILPGDGNATDMRRHFAATIRTGGVEEALRQARTHYRAAVEDCRVLPLADVGRDQETTTTPAARLAKE